MEDLERERFIAAMIQELSVQLQPEEKPIAKKLNGAEIYRKFCYDFVDINSDTIDLSVLISSIEQMKKPFFSFTLVFVF